MAPAARFSSSKNGDVEWIDLPEGGRLEHDRRAPLQLPPGVWRVRQQREGYAVAEDWDDVTCELGTLMNDLELRPKWAGDRSFSTAPVDLAAVAEGSREFRDHFGMLQTLHPPLVCPSPQAFRQEITRLGWACHPGLTFLRRQCVGSLRGYFFDPQGLDEAEAWDGSGPWFVSIAHAFHRGWRGWEDPRHCFRVVLQDPPDHCPRCHGDPSGSPGCPVEKDERFLDLCPHLLDVEDLRTSIATAASGAGPGLERIFSGCLAWVPAWSRDVVCERPRVLRLDGRGCAHCASGPAVVWRDGTEEYWFRGSPVDAEFVAALRLPLDQLPESLWNDYGLFQEQRLRDALLRWQFARLRAAGAVEHVHTDRFGTLWAARIGPCDVRFVEVRDCVANPRTGVSKLHWLRVPCNIPTAHAAVAWTFGLAPGDYDPDLET